MHFSARMVFCSRLCGTPSGAESVCAAVYCDRAGAVRRLHAVPDKRRINTSVSQKWYCLARRKTGKFRAVAHFQYLLFLGCGELVFWLWPLCRGAFICSDGTAWLTCPAQKRPVRYATDLTRFPQASPGVSGLSDQFDSFTANPGADHSASVSSWIA